MQNIESIKYRIDWNMAYRTGPMEAEESLAALSEKEVEELKVDQELMTCVRRKVKQLARELGMLQQPESEEIGLGEDEEGSQESQDLLRSSQ